LAYRIVESLDRYVTLLDPPPVIVVELALRALAEANEHWFVAFFHFMVL
jgi:hypothetical protein